MSDARIKIEIVKGGEVLETKPFSGDTIEIGKLSRSDVKVEDENVSRKHARIEIESDGRVFVQDLSSTNGTRLNGMRVTRAGVMDGDEIEVGITVLRVRLGEELKKVAKANAPSARTQISHDGFYSTEEKVKGKQLALEAALLWEDSPVQVDSFRRQRIPTRLRASLLLLFAVGPVQLWFCAILLALLSDSPSASIGAGAAGLGLAIYFLMDLDSWRELLTRNLWLMKHGEGIYVGETHECRFFLPSDTVGQREYPLLVPHGTGWALNLAHADIKGDLLVNGKVMTVQDARQSDLVSGTKLPMAPGTKCRLRFGQFSMLLSYVSVPKRPEGGAIVGMDLQELAYLGLSLLIHFGILILFVYMHPEDEIQVRRGKSDMMARFVQVESIKAKEKEEEEEEEEIEPEQAEKSDVKLDDGQKSEKLIQEKKTTFVKRPKTNRKFKTATERKLHNRAVAKKTSEKYIPSQTLARITGSNLLNRSNNSGLKILGSAGKGGPSDGYNAFAGATTSNSGGGFLGLNDMGGTVGAGNAGNKKLIVAGLGKQGRKKGKRLGNVKFKESVQRAIVRTGSVRVSGGGLTRAIIKKYINRQKGSIIHCYKRAVQKNPDLEGKVIVSFMISPTGRVMSPGIRSSTLGSASVTACIKKKLRFWRFPAPPNAGASRVTYPFLFRTR